MEKLLQHLKVLKHRFQLESVIKGVNNVLRIYGDTDIPNRNFRTFNSEKKF